MEKDARRKRGRRALFAFIFAAVNVLGLLFFGLREAAAIRGSLSAQAQKTQEQFNEVMLGYKRSFQLFSRMMAREIEEHPDPDAIWDYLKSVDTPLLEIEGDTFDGLYMCYQGRYLYSWDTPYSVYEDSGYVVTERPWYQAAVAGRGDIVFTPPYMSYANHYILTTISQLQPDGETVFAYDIKMGDIQALVSSMDQFDREQILIFDTNGTVIGSTEEHYLGGGFYSTLEQTARARDDAQAELDALAAGDAERAKAQDKLDSAAAFYAFRQDFDAGFAKLQSQPGQVAAVRIGGTPYLGYLLGRQDYNFLILVPLSSLLMATTDVWLVPLLVMELLLIYLLSRVSKEQKNRELKAAYVELGQIQKRLEIALSTAQKAAAIDELTGMMNFRSFRREMTQVLEDLEENSHGIFIMIDGDHFKQVNDQYGHNVGDEVIKLSAQMIVGRIRTVDLASRLHGDEFAIFVANTEDYTVAQGIMRDINATLAKEAKKRNIPAITLSAGAVVADKGDTYVGLSKAADVALYRAKESHNGGFACSEGAPAGREG